MTPRPVAPYAEPRTLLYGGCCKEHLSPSLVGHSLATILRLPASFLLLPPRVPCVARGGMEQPLLDMACTRARLLLEDRNAAFTVGAARVVPRAPQQQ